MQRIKIDLPQKFIFTTEISVRVYDVNFAGHLSNDSILSMVHEARILFLKNWNYSEVDTCGAGIIMFDAALQYKSQGYHGDILLFEVTVDNFIKNGCKLVPVPEKFRSLIDSLKN